MTSFDLNADISSSVLEASEIAIKYNYQESFLEEIKGSFDSETTLFFCLKNVEKELVSKEEQDQLEELTLHWNQYKYLKNRHLLVELRNEPFTLRDFFMPEIQKHTESTIPYFNDNLNLDSDIPILPLGSINNK